MYLQSKCDSFYFLMKHMVRMIREKCTNVIMMTMIMVMDAETQSYMQQRDVAKS
jgi:hypothetical protein